MFVMKLFYEQILRIQFRKNKDVSTEWYCDNSIPIETSLYNHDICYCSTIRMLLFYNSVEVSLAKQIV